MNDITHMDLGMLPEHSQRFYDLSLIINGSGFFALWGWLALFAIPITAFVVISRHLVRPQCHARGTHFFAVAHVCFLFFLLTVVVSGHMLACLCSEPNFSLLVCLVAQNQISLAVGLGTVMISSLIVAAALKRMPRPDPWACLGLVSAATSIALITAIFLRLSI